MASIRYFYSRIDEFPPGPDRPLFFKLTAEVPVQQETLLRIFLIGMAKSLPLNDKVGMEILENIQKIFM